MFLAEGLLGLVREIHSVSLAGRDNNQVATKMLPGSETFGSNPAFITMYVKLIYQINECEPTANNYHLKGLFKVPKGVEDPLKLYNLG